MRPEAVVGSSLVLQGPLRLLGCHNTIDLAFFRFDVFRHEQSLDSISATPQVM